MYPPVNATWVVLGGWLLIALGIDSLSLALRPDDLHWMQILTAHWVHVDLQHAVANALGWLIAVVIFRDGLMKLALLVVTAGCGVGIGWLLVGEAAGYAGLSGVLYAIAAFVSLGWLNCRTTRYLGALALAGMLVSASGVMQAGDRWNFEVAAVAHLLGALVGIVMGLTRQAALDYGLVKV